MNTLIKYYINGNVLGRKMIHRFDDTNKVTVEEGNWVHIRLYRVKEGRKTEAHLLWKGRMTEGRKVK